MVRWGQGLAAWSMLAAAVALDCGKTSTVSPNGSGGAAVAANPDLVAPTTVAALCETYPAAWGDFMARCYGGEAADWASLAHQPCAETALAEEAGRISLNEAKVAECFAVLAGGECLFGPRQSQPQCSDLVTGSLPVGQPCEPLGYGDECVSVAHCDATGGCAGTCKLLGIEGETCRGLFVDVDCGPGLGCDGPSAVCKVPGANGKPCAGQLCELGLYCDAEDRQEGTCRPLETAGPCQSDRVCAPGYTCIRDDAGAGACTRVKRTGAPCTVGLRECAGYCSPTGICRVVANEGEICQSGKDIAANRIESIPCGLGLFCDRLSNESLSDSICRRQLPPGAAWPETAASGNPCAGGNTRSFITPDARVCAICD